MSVQDKNKSSILAILSLVFGIIGALTTCLLIGIVFCIAGLVTGIISLACKYPKRGLAISGVIASSIGVIIFAVILIIYVNTVSTYGDTAASAEIATEVEETTEPEVITETKESADDYKASCKEIGYKQLLRTPDDFIEQRIVITAEVKQILKGGLFDDGTYYRLQTDNDGYDWYMDDEYFMYDFRDDDDMKILEGDVLKVYGEFAGLETVERALTSTKDEIPTVKIHYVELISE